jgi:hypothetical protein
MKKYLIGTMPRSGTTLYALWLAQVLTKNIDQGFQFNGLSKFNCRIEKVNWTCPIIHTHDVWLFNMSELDRHVVVCQRNLFDLVLSQIIANHTQVYHVRIDSDVTDYQSRFSNTRISVPKQVLCQQLITAMRNSYMTDRIIQQRALDCTRVTYEIHGQDQQIFYQAMGLTLSPEHNLLQPNLKKIPINKYSMIENLQDCIDLYEKFQPDFFDPATDPYRLEKIQQVRAYIENDLVDKV